MFSSLKQTFLLLAVLMLLAGCALFKPESAPPGPEPSAEAGREIQGNAYYYYIRSHMAQKAGNLEQAISFLEKTLDAGKEELFLKKELIYLYLQNQEDQKALAESENILEDHPEDVEALIIAATIKQHQNYPSEAAGLLEKVIEQAPDRDQIYMLLGDLYLDSGELKKAASLYQKMVDRFPNKWESHFLLGKIYEKQEEFAAAEKQYKKSMDLAPKMLSPRYALIALFKQQEKGVTTITLEKNDTISSLSQEFYGDYNSRIKEKILEANPDIKNINAVSAGQTIRFPLSPAESSPSHKQAIIDLYRSILEKHPEEYRAALQLAVYYHTHGEKTKATEKLTALGKKCQSNPRIAQYVSQLYIEPGKLDQAHLILDGLQQSAPDQPALHYLSGILCEREKKYQKAIGHFSQVKADSNFFEMARLKKAMLFEKTGQTDKAAEVFDSLLQASPENADLLLYAGSFFERQENYQKAQTLYEQGLSQDPENADLHYRLGVVHDKTGQKEAVIHHMKKVLSIAPENPNALNYLGYTYAVMGIKLDRAQSMIEKAMSLDPDNGYFTDSLGWVYYKRGDIKKALEYLERAVLLSPNDPVLLEHLGDAYLKKGDHDKALKFYRRSLENCEPDEKTAVQQKIKKIEKGRKAP